MKYRSWTHFSESKTRHVMQLKKNLIKVSLTFKKNSFKKHFKTAASIWNACFFFVYFRGDF